MAQDSPLAVSASVIGILTFVVAVIVGVYARALWLKGKLHSAWEIAEIAETVAISVQDTTQLAVLLNYPSLRGFYDNSAAHLLVQMYEIELLLAVDLARLDRQSTVQRIREWDKVRARMTKGLKDIESLNSRLRDYQFKTQLVMLSTKLNEILDLARPEQEGSAYIRNAPQSAVSEEQNGKGAGATSLDENPVGPPSPTYRQEHEVEGADFFSTARDMVMMQLTPEEKELHYALLGGSDPKILAVSLGRIARDMEVQHATGFLARIV